MADPRPYKQLIRWVVRAFYPGTCPPKHYQDEADDMARSKLSKIDTSGLAVITLEYLLEREWVAEEQICEDLGQHHKIMRRALKFLEQEHLLMGEHRRETKRMQKNDVVKAAVTTKAAQMAEIQGHKEEEDDEEEDAPKKQHTYSYWSVDYPRAYDMIQLRLTIMRKLLKDELDSREVVAQYVCKAPHCNKEFTSFDMPDLVTFDGSLKCTMCGGNVEQLFATGQTGDDEQRRARRSRLQSLLKAMESQLEEIIRLTVQLKTAQAPHHGTLTDWARGQQAKLQAAAAGAGGDAAARARVHGGVTQLTAAGGAARTAMYQETHVQVTLAGEEAAAGPSGSAAAPSKSGAAAAAGSGAKGAAGKAPSLQPFFLRQNHAESDGQGHQAQTAGGAGVSVQAAAQAGVQEEEKKQDMDEYTKQMLAMMGQGGAAAAAAGSREDDEDASPPAKRMKTEAGVKAEGAAVAEGADQAAAGAAAEDEEWEDI